MLSREFLLERGYCCGHGCLMCPYHPKHTEGNTKVMRVGIVTGVFDLLHRTYKIITLVSGKM